MVVEQAAEAVIITDTEGAIEYVNPAFERMAGYSASEVLGHNPRLLKSGRQDAAFYGNLWATLARGETWIGRMSNRRKDGSEYEVEAVLSPIRDANGWTMNYVSIARDITREVQLEQQFREAQKMEAIGRLAGGIAHDFNNLLTSILGFARFAREAAGAESTIAEDVDEVLRAAERAAQLTKQLLTFSRRQVVQVEPLDINSVLIEMDRLLRRTLGENVELVTLPDPDAGGVQADIGLLEQAIMNLAINARDAMPQGGTLTLQTQRMQIPPENMLLRNGASNIGDRVRLTVADTGVGMSADVREHCFEPFFTTKEKGKGTGLGLALVYNIVHQFEGSIEVESTPGNGTRVHLLFPRVDSPLAAARPAAEDAGVPGGTETILVVEDEESVRRLTVRLLTDLGYHVLEARNGSEALLLFLQHVEPVHLVLSDIVMPQMGGPEMVGRMWKARPGFRVLYISGFTDSSSLPSPEPGVSASLLLKPFTQERLARKVRDVLDTASPG